MTSSVEHEAGQLADLAALGLDWDGPVVRQSERRAAHEAALAELVGARPHLPLLLQPAGGAGGERARRTSAPGTYPGHLPGPQRRRGARRAWPAVGPAALRLRAVGEPVTIVDRLRGAVTRPADDIVLRRNDGVPAYHVAVVVDDDDQGVEEVVRGDDLLDATPSQAHLLDLLGRPRPGLGARARWWSAPTASGSPSATVPSPWPTSRRPASARTRCARDSPSASASRRPASR